METDRGGEVGGNTWSMAQDLHTRKEKGQHPTRGTRIRHTTNKKEPQKRQRHIQKGKGTQDQKQEERCISGVKTPGQLYTLLYFTLL
jgi:predicted phage gp36 major capsid-like protein